MYTIQNASRTHNLIRIDSNNNSDNNNNNNNNNNDDDDDDNNNCKSNNILDQSALIDLSFFYRARFASYSIEHGLPRFLSVSY